MVMSLIRARLKKLPTSMSPASRAVQGATRTSLKPINNKKRLNYE
jgi:hypothetical protein